ncbi:lytic transglycosylase domain-containing protein [Mesorhizobium sp. M1B.F.Ca.ET.045.04.1.1]|uniref:lytic transglycosylase domain-containing protein n=1 Tax=Mesorhizobium sp. M1B.F.Ca.ET.045.04.1.1 TaxID=2493673 RepID=UPI000F7624E6|nr:lytic transglycosylase domain-containing protein [Mesorhizobium sp. M1B.F.Ca.ET.045.04.1.1]AZO28358.1 lytic transglycosylase domain-containing protein [Mesorhizobium sp. M1B.F.Ca.ET.045.04.1.1]
MARRPKFANGAKLAALLAACSLAAFALPAESTEKQLILQDVRQTDAQKADAPAVRATSGSPREKDYVLKASDTIASIQLTGARDDRELSVAHQFDNAEDRSSVSAKDQSQSAGSNQFGNVGPTRAMSGTGARPGACGPSPYEPDQIAALVIAAAKRHQVEQSLAVAVAAVESDFDRNRNSPAGARGPMQLMPQTAVRFGLDDPCEPVANIDAGVRHLGELIEEFQNPILAVAAYNAGEDRIYQYGGIPPFSETVSYVAKVLNHQLGISVPRRAKNGSPYKGSAVSPLADRGVITPDRRRQWAGGVMQF